MYLDCLKFTYDNMLLPEEFGECHNLSDHMTPCNTDQWDIFKVTHKSWSCKKQKQIFYTDLINMKSNWFLLVEYPIERRQVDLMARLIVMHWSRFTIGNRCSVLTHCQQIYCSCRNQLILNKIQKLHSLIKLYHVK